MAEPAGAEPVLDPDAERLVAEFAAVLNGGIVHIAGLDATVGHWLRQRCAWCGAVLIDYELDCLAVPVGQDPTPGTWPPGELVLVDGPMSTIVEHIAGAELPPNACAVLNADEITAKQERAVAELASQLEDERGSHAMTQSHFADYSEEWTAALAEKRRELARLTQLLDAAQRDRDEAQADASMFAGVIEAFREIAVELRDYDDSADPEEPRPWQKYFAGRVLALLAELPKIGEPR